MLYGNKLGQFIRNGWTVTDYDQSTDTITMVKQFIDNIIVIYDGTELLNA